MDEKSRRRWLRYSLRTLLLAITVVCTWLAWQVSVVRERREIIVSLARPGDGATYFVTLQDWESTQAQPVIPGQYDALQVPAIRRLLGDPTYLQISVRSDVDRQLLRRAEHAFPEAMIVVFSGGWVLSSRDPILGPADQRQPNTGDYFETGFMKEPAP